MKLDKKKKLVARMLNVGKEKVAFNRERLKEIKEVITRQDIRDLIKDKAIIIKPGNGRRKIEKRKRKRGEGKIKKRVKERKREYVRRIRKIRKHLKLLKEKGMITREEHWKLRRLAKAGLFFNIKKLEEYIKERKK